MTCRIDLIAGTRPNVIKIAPLFRALKAQAWCEPRILYLQQHVAANMAADLFGPLGVADDEVHQIPLDAIGYGPRLGQIIDRYGAEIGSSRPDLAVVPGDVDVSLGAALAARRLHVPLAHLEAGLRSYDPLMPEEANRVLIDSISDLLLAPSEASAQNLIYREGRSHQEVHFVGNIMIDALVQVLSETVASAALSQFGLHAGKFAILTLHRPSNVDDPATLEKLLAFVDGLSVDCPILFPVHPRTRETLSVHLAARGGGRLIACDPIDYVRFVNLISKARYVVTDSGGVQEETTFLGTPCFTFRDSTERPITLYQGANHMVDLHNARAVIDAVLAQPAPGRPTLPLWDGLTAWRVAQVLRQWWEAKKR